MTIRRAIEETPTIWVGWGQRSIDDDMAAAHINTEFMTEEDFAQAVAERKAQQQRSGQSAGGNP
jgi:hypothetical protein